MLLADIQSQPGATAVLQQAISRDRLAHSYLFVGPSGVGKQSAALALAKAVICSAQPGRGCGRCEPCRRIDEDKHPDVRVFLPRDEGNRNLPVEFVRSEVLPFAKFAPFEASAAFVIFPHADLSFPVQHAEAANAMLKTLEEPRKNVHFVLTSERPDRLLPTIRSRCQRVRFATLPPATLEGILERHGIEPQLRGPAVALARGRADLALALCEEGRAQELFDWAVRVDTALGEARAGALLELSEELSRHAERALVIESLCLYYRDVAARALGLPDGSLAFRHRLDEIGERARSLSASAAAARVARLQQLTEDVERNANPQLALDGLLLGLRAGR